ncbi:MAG: hypothetical protein AB8H86_08610 [Polyangiales bacterium]
MADKRTRTLRFLISAALLAGPAGCADDPSEMTPRTNEAPNVEAEETPLPATADREAASGAEPAVMQPAPVNANPGTAAERGRPTPNLPFMHEDSHRESVRELLREE